MEPSLDPEVQAPHPKVMIIIQLMVVYMMNMETNHPYPNYSSQTITNVVRKEWDVPVNV